MLNSPNLLFSDPHIVIPKDYGDSQVSGLSQTEGQIVIPEQSREPQLASLSQPQKLPLLGELLQQAALVSEQQIQQVLKEQKKMVKFFDSFIFLLSQMPDERNGLTSNLGG